MKYNRRRQSQAGFTLIEILVVMVIIGILAVLGAGSFQSSQLKGRDARRKADLKQITNALETYYNDKREYPLSISGQIAGCANESSCAWGGEWSDENGTVYMVTMPEDPKRNFTYYYDSDGVTYQLYARLENNLDKDVPKDAQGDSQVYSGLDCGAESCNYGVASTNSSATEGRTLVSE